MRVPKNVHINIAEFTIGKVAVRSVGDFLFGISLLGCRLPGYLVSGFSSKPLSLRPLRCFSLINAESVGNRIGRTIGRC